VKANGYAHIPAPVEGYEAGTQLEVLLTTDPGSIERTLFFTGTLDPALEELASRAHDEGLFIHATNPGNISGLLALAGNSCHAAPLVLPPRSLLTSYQPLMQFAGAGDLAFIHIASVELGITSREGLEARDLSRIRFINTRKETPSRTVLDALLAAERIDPSQVNGYLHEVHGPQAVAVAVRNGFADAGICTSGIASANGLRFVPVAHEDYEIVMRRATLADLRFRTLVSLIRSPGYQAALGAIGGYDSTLTGTIRALDGSRTLAPFEPGGLPAGSL
jgi:putative molybdopterin biosynthesis protein